MKIGGLQQCSLIDYPGKIVAIVFTVGCNFRCPYCHNPELVNETCDEIDTEKIFAFLKTRIGRLDGVTITGGEPTMHEDLKFFIKKIKKMGFLVKLDTNGTNPNIVKELIEEKLIDYVAMDIKGPLNEYSKIVDRPVDIYKIKESIILLKKNLVSYEFRTTVVKALLSPEDIEQIGKDISGAKTYYFQKFVPTKILNPAFIKKTTYSDNEFKELKTIMEKYVTNCYIR